VILPLGAILLCERTLGGYASKGVVVVTPNEELREQIRAMPDEARVRFERRVAEQLQRSALRQGKPVPPAAARILAVPEHH
jgi:hypothetical protein